MAKSWAEWETSLNQGANPAELLGLPTETTDNESSRLSSNLTVPFEGEEFKFFLSRPPPPSVNHVASDVLVAQPNIPFEELFPPLFVDPQPEFFTHKQMK